MNVAHMCQSLATACTDAAAREAVRTRLGFRGDWPCLAVMMMEVLANRFRAFSSLMMLPMALSMYTNAACSRSTD